MKCRQCNCCHEEKRTRWTYNGWATETVQMCYGVKEPFVITDVNKECTEYPERRSLQVKLTAEDLYNPLEHCSRGNCNGCDRYIKLNGSNTYQCRKNLLQDCLTFISNNLE